MGASVSDFFTKNPNLKKQNCFLGGGWMGAVGGGGGG